MKHLKLFDNYNSNSNSLTVEWVVDKVGKEKAAKILTHLFKGKYVTFEDSMVAKSEYPSIGTNSGTVDYVFYISSSGFIVARIDDDTYSDLIVDRSTIFYEGELDFDGANVLINVDKYNI